VSLHGRRSAPTGDAFAAHAPVFSGRQSVLEMLNAKFPFKFFRRKASRRERTVAALSRVG
jgi:hypothetical protein